MKEFKGTPGPWQTEMQYMSDIPDNAAVVITAAARSNKHTATFVAQAKFSPSHPECFVSVREEAEANAHLIAAAPELLESAKKALQLLQERRLDGGMVGADLENAIAKALGND